MMIGVDNDDWVFALLRKYDIWVENLIRSGEKKNVISLYYRIKRLSSQIIRNAFNSKLVCKTDWVFLVMNEPFQGS